MLSVLPYTKVAGQSNQSDSNFYQSAVYNAINFYRQSTHDQSRLYNGREYKPYRIAFIEGTPFFQSDKFTEGSVIYEGAFYDKVKLLYDEVQDMLIMNVGFNIELIKERIEQFTLPGHTFIRLISDSLNNNFTAGFYEKLYSGKIEVYKKEKKSIKENLSITDGIRGEILKKIYYYIKKDGRYYSFSKKKNIFEILAGHKKEIQQFAKNNKLSFKNDADNMLIKIAVYYDQLTK